MDPFRLRVQKALSAALEQISVANGDHHDLAGSVFRGRAIFGDDDPLPMLSILEEAIAPESNLGPVTSQAASGTYNLMIQGFVDDDKANPTDPAHLLLADVKKKLAQLRAEARSDQGVLGFGRKAPVVDQLAFDGGVVRPPDGEVSARAYFWLRLTLTLIEDHENPFA